MPDSGDIDDPGERRVSILALLGGAVLGGIVAAAGALAVRRGRAQGLRVAVVTVLLLVAAAHGTQALRTASEPENNCVPYSGGRRTCPGG